MASISGCVLHFRILAKQWPQILARRSRMGAASYRNLYEKTSHGGQLEDVQDVRRNNRFFSKNSRRSRVASHTARSSFALRLRASPPRWKPPAWNPPPFRNPPNGLASAMVAPATSGPVTARAAIAAAASLCASFIESLLHVLPMRLDDLRAAAWKVESGVSITSRSIRTGRSQGRSRNAPYVGRS